MSKLNIVIDLDTESLTGAITTVKDLNDNNKVFGILSGIAKPKAELKEALEAIEAVEREIKQVISDRARSLYGNDWKVIAGTGYKIGRSMSGSVYDFNGEPEPQFVKVARSIDTDAVTDYVKGNGKLPDGVAINPNRTEVIKLTVKSE